MNKVSLHWCRPVIRLALGAVFLTAGLIKLRQPVEFEAAVASFRILPNDWIPLFAASLPALEALAGFWLLLGWRIRIPLLASLLLSAGFLAAIAQAMVRGLNVDCGCFGAASAGAPHLAWAAGRDLLLLLGAGWLWHRETLLRLGSAVP